MKLFALSLIFVPTKLLADEVIPLRVEDGYQISKVVKRSGLGMEVVEYVKTKIDSEDKLQTMQENATENQARPSAKPSPKAAVNVAPVIEVKPPVGKVMPNNELIIKAEGSTGREAALLKKIKALKAAENEGDDRAKIALKDGLTTATNSAVTNKSAAVKKVSNRNENAIISRLEFNQASILDVARALADISNLNFVATEEAAKKTITVFLQNISVKNALDTITKNAGLWYRQDKDSGTFRIMSTKEYQQDLIVYREDVTKVFNLHQPNPVVIATAIRDLYGERVLLSYGSDYDEFPTGEFNSGSNGAGNRNGGGANRGGRSGLSGGQSSLRRGITSGNSRTNLGGGMRNQQNLKYDEEKYGTTANGAITEELTADQLEKIEMATKVDENGNLIEGGAVRGITKAQQPIYITVNRQQNMIIMRTSDTAVVKEIEALVQAMDKPTPQVLLEMKILEVDVGDTYSQLFSFSALSKNGKHRAFGLEDTDNANTGKFVYGFVDDLINIKLELLEETNKARIVSSPLLLTSNNRTARLFVGEERLLVRGATLTDAVFNQNGFVLTPSRITYETEIRNIGNTLNITPKINADGTVTLGIFQDSSTVIEDAVDFPPLVNNGVIVNIALDSVQTSNIEGVVVARDGLTVAIGGLISTSTSQRERKVPVLGDMPIVGNLFKDKYETESRKEMILLITPHIMTEPEQGDDVTRDAVEPISVQAW